MPVRVFDRGDVHELLPMNACIDVMAEALATLAEGRVQQPLRTAHWLPDRRGLLGLMPGSLDSAGILGVKVLTVFPGNDTTEFESHQGCVLLFEAKQGCLVALLDASELTAIRTAAVSALATRHLALESAGDLAILGSGTQARTHLEAMQCVRPIRRVRVWSRSFARARVFAKAAYKKHGIAVEPVATARAAVTDADLVCTVTGAREPILKGDWLREGTHVNAVGACTPHHRELDSQAILRARLIVDRRESALAEAGDFLFPRNEGVVSDAHLRGELGEVVTGRVRARESADDITVFKSLGLAVEDLAAAHYIHRRGQEENVGTVLELGGRRHGPA